MKPLLIELPKKAGTSFEVLDYERPNFHNPVHFHSYLELTLILKGEGVRIVGDHIEHFKEGDLVLIGKNLPHQWKNSITVSDTSVSKAIVVHFQENCFGNDFFQRPDAVKIAKLIEYAKRGLKINGKTYTEVMPIMHQLLESQGFERTLVLLTILNKLSESKNLVPLASLSYKIDEKSSEINKIDQIYEFILSNLNRKISLDEISGMFHMSRTGFCRYFKRHTQKTFSKFVLDARISNACKLLMENNLTVEQVAYDSGFNQLSFFIREFKKNRGLTPLKYRKYIQSSEIRMS